MWRKRNVLLIGLVLLPCLIGAAQPVSVFLQVLDSEPGFGGYLWYNDDFGWTHLVPRDVARSRLLDASLTIEAYDVDQASGEVDLIYVDAGLLGPLQGADDAWFSTVFSLDDLSGLLGDGQLDVFADIDSTHGSPYWGVTIGRSILEITYREVAPRLRILSLSAPVGGGGATGGPGGPVEVVLGNLGSERYVGPCMIDAGLAYSTLWIPEWCTVFDTHEVGVIDLMPGETMTIMFDLADVPESIFELFRERLQTVWTGYADTDPDDYVGFVVQFDGLPPQVDYGPLY